MYLRECLLENAGPIGSMELTLQFNKDGSPKPLLLVGENGSGKTILLSHIVDALIEFAKAAQFTDVVSQKSDSPDPYFRLVATTNQTLSEPFGIALLEFKDRDNRYSYVEKTGVLEPNTLNEKRRGRFDPVREWPTEGNEKRIAPKDPVAFVRIFRESVICYFPCSRKEVPHWLVPASVPGAEMHDMSMEFSNLLQKPIVAESSLELNKRWLLDLLFYSRVDVEFSSNGSPQRVSGDFVGVRMSKTILESANVILRHILGDDSVRLATLNRSQGILRLCIGKNNTVVIPTLNHLSAGQVLLLNVFLTILRYADRPYGPKAAKMEDIEGIVIVDEVDAHLHSELQFTVLPSLLKCFPKVQFILTTHSPIVLLGMERKYGADGFQVIQMPRGDCITAEKFREFTRHFEYYRETKAFEEEISSALAKGSKPLVLVEGETDPSYIQRALELLGESGLLAELEIAWVGTRARGGLSNTGDSGLSRTWTVLLANPQLVSRKVLLLYDCETNKATEDRDRVSIRKIPMNAANSKVTAGIENLFPERLFEQRFYAQRAMTGKYGEKKVIEDFDKTGFCRWVCMESRKAEDFKGFSVVVNILKEFLAR